MKLDISKVKVVALSGGVGGAKLVLGLSRIMKARELLVVTNTGDDFEHFGLRICPDTDTVLYNLAGLADVKRGWGRADETWNFMSSIKQFNGETWFKLGDKDLALHIWRTDLLRKGFSLAQVTAKFCEELGLTQLVTPATNHNLRTFIVTKSDWIPFQTYFVQDNCSHEVVDFEYEGATYAHPAPLILEALKSVSLEAIIFCPSNPFVSLNPILSIEQIRQTIIDSPVAKVGVSPIVGGKALKGPAAKMMIELGLQPSAYNFARYYQNELGGVIVDIKDRDLCGDIANLQMETMATNTIMSNLTDKINLAKDVLLLAKRITSKREV